MKDKNRHPNVLEQKKITDKSQERVSAWFTRTNYACVTFGQLKGRRKTGGRRG